MGDERGPLPAVTLRIEAGLETPTLETLLWIERLIGVPVAELLM
ncbi:hypothetical protein [Streptomyces bauhiniae]|nr:hypothetical protein [Streptomyces bauhiniae]